jgi:hypothetical protein
MKIFISYSGPLGESVANCLYEWLKRLIRCSEPWVSFKDMPAGAKWSDVIPTVLAQSDICIICLTRDSVLAPWIHYEAGLFSAFSDHTLLCPFLIGTFSEEDISKLGPLNQFHMVKADREGTKKLIRCINKRLEESGLHDKSLMVKFDNYWPKLDFAITACCDGISLCGDWC